MSYRAPAGRVRCVIHDARNFAALTVTDLPIVVHERLCRSAEPYQLTVDRPLELPPLGSPVEYAQQAYTLHIVTLRGILFRLSPSQTFTLIVTDTPQTARLLDPELLPGQRRRSEEEIYRDAFEAGERNAMRRMNPPPRR